MAAVISTYIVGKCYVSFLHVDSYMTADGTYKVTVLLLDILMTTGIGIVIDSLNRTGFGCVDLITRDDTAVVLTLNCKLFGLISIRVEVCDSIIEQVPACCSETALEPVLITVCIGVDSVERSLTDVNSVITEVIEETVDLMETCQLLAILVVSIAALLDNPAILGGVEESILILELLINGAEVTTALNRLPIEILEWI